MKIKIAVLSLTAAIFSYTGYAFYQIKTAHPYKLIYTSVYGDWEYFDSRLPPFPFRNKIARHELKTRPLAEYDKWPSFELLPYTILAMKDAGKFEEVEYQKKLEALVDDFLIRGMSIDKKSSTGCTSLQLAIIDKDLAAMEFLKARNASLLESLGSENKDLCQRSVASLTQEYIE